MVAPDLTLWTMPSQDVATPTIDPAEHDHEVVVGIDETDVRAGAEHREGRLGDARPLFLPGVQPPHVPVLRIDIARRRRQLDPTLGEELTVAPLALAQEEIADPRQIAGRDPHASAPVPAAADRLDRLAVDGDVGIAVAVPLPCGRGADRRHHLLAQHVRERTLPDEGGVQGDAIDADVVVLVEGARLLELPILAAPAIRGIVLAP